MPSYCSISEAWGTDFNNEEIKPNKVENNTLQPQIESYTLMDKNENKCFDEIKCKNLLNEILKCKECQDLIYKHLKEQYNQSNILNDLIQNNDILNILFLGIFIILFLDFIMKIGRYNRQR